MAWSQIIGAHSMLGVYASKGNENHWTLSGGSSYIIKVLLRKGLADGHMQVRCADTGCPVL